MARKNMDILVGNILGDATIQPQEKNEKTDVTSKEKQNTPQSPKNNKAFSKEDHGSTSPSSVQLNLWSRFKPLPTRKVSLSVPLWNTL